MMKVVLNIILKDETLFHTGLLAKKMVLALEHLDHALSGLSNTNPLDLKEKETKTKTHIEELSLKHCC